MSKKSRRNRAKNQTSGKRIQKEKIVPVEPSKSSSESKIPVTTISHGTSLAKSSQYQYVITDLRNIGLITAVLVIILIVLTFILG